MGIRIYDPATHLVHYPYVYENGQRHSIPSRPLSPRGFAAHVIGTRETLVLNENMPQALEKYGSSVLPGMQMEKSAVYVPLVVNDQARGLIVLGNMEREYAFGDSDVRLLRTLANSMSIALENARLFDETQRLLKETERRSSELAVINSIQQGMAAELNFQAIVDLVGDKLRELFRTGDIGIRWRDEKTELVHHLYIYEHGERLSFPPSKYNPDSKLVLALLKGAPVVIRNQAEADVLGIKTAPGTDSSLSSVFLPIFLGDRLLGSLVLESFEREDAYSDAEVKLLSTVAASMGVALENARLLEETQRRAREAAALADVGRELSSSLDLATVMDSIARHAKDLLQAGNSAIFLPDQGTSTYRAIVAIGETAEAIRATVVEGGVGIIGSLLESGQPELINDTQADPRGVQIPGTERKRDERLMVVPLLADGAVEGAMAVWRTGGRPFDQHELEFLVGLSRQATVALHNARLFNETKQALERQTATAEVLKVISESPTDVQPVFDVIAERAARLTGADYGWVFRFDGNLIHVASSYGVNAQGVEAARLAFPMLPGSGSAAARSVRDRTVVNIGDVSLEDDAQYTVKSIAEVAGYRSVLSVPMWRDEQIVGVITVTRAEVGQFHGKEVDLLQTFARQAVIAIENVRLFNETKEALEQQTATAEVLQRDQQLGGRHRAGVRQDPRQLPAPVRHRAARHIPRRRRRPGARGRVARFGGRGRRPIVPQAARRHDDGARHPRAPHGSHSRHGDDDRCTGGGAAASPGSSATFSVAWAPMLWEDRGVGLDLRHARSRRSRSPTRSSRC